MSEQDPVLLSKLTVSAQLSEGIVETDGTINVRVLSRTLGAVISEVLSGQMNASRAHAGIRGMRTLVALADAVRRSSDAAQPLMRIGGKDSMLTSGKEDTH